MPEGDPIAEVYNRIPKYVASRSLLKLEWANSHQLGEDIAGEVAKLKEEGDGEIRVAGSSELVQTLLSNDLVDEFQLVVFPSIIGSGKRLFGDGTIPRGLSLKKVETTAKGVAIHVYERTGDLQTAEFGPEVGDSYR
jgi:dihydrofolate reductase